MIRVTATRSEPAGTEGALRPVNAFFEGTSAASRRLEEGAGESVERRLRDLGDLPVGGAVITPAGDLPFSFLIHAVVQTPEEPVSEASVRRALVNGLRRAEEWGIESLTLLPFGLGPGNLEPDDSARITASVLHEVGSTADTLSEVVVALTTQYELDVFQRSLDRTFGGANPSQ